MAVNHEQRANNREKSKTGTRVEHVFGFMEQSMKGLIVLSVRITRASGIIEIINLTYNLFQYEQLKRLKNQYILTEIGEIKYPLGVFKIISL
jgi:IS5 family transposase